MANVTFKKSLILFVLMLSFSFSVLAQKKGKLKEFSKEFPTYLIELGDFMSATDNSDLKSAFKTFKNKADDLTASEKEIVISISDKMLKKRLRSKPHFFEFLTAVVVVDNHAKGGSMLLEWLNVVEETVKETTIKKLVMFFSFTKNLVAENTLRSSKSANWNVGSAVYNFEFEMIEPVIVFVSPFNLSCSAEGGSYEIKATKGRYYFVSNEWIGKNGVLDWESQGMSKDSVYAEINSYKIDTRKSLIVADSSFFWNKYIFKKPIIGEFINKVARGKQSENYPKFTSYRKNIELKDIFPNIDYRGGYKMNGKEFIADGGDYAEAKIVFKSNGKDVFIANAKRFSLKSDRISSKEAGVKIYFDEDSIYHSNLQFKYIDSKRQLQLYRKSNSISGAPMLNTYHNVTMDFELLQWDIDGDIITFGSLPGTAESRVEFESVDRYLQQKFESMQGIDAIHPLFLVNNYVKAKQEERFFVEDFVRFSKFPMVQIQHYLIQLANDGFIFYDFGEERITVLPKLYNYINAASEISDYDVITFSSLISEKYGGNHIINAALNIASKDLNILGIDSIILSSARGVRLYPNKGRVVLKKNRDFIFNGQVSAGNGRLNLFGRDFKFNYNEFKLDLPKIDYSQFSVPKKDKYGFEELIPIKTLIEAVSGDLRIDDPTNKSGVSRDSFPEYPIFRSSEYSYAYYDNKSIHDGVYSRERFFFHLEPFEIDSLDTFKAEGLWFAGIFESAGIFPTFNDTLRLQDDYALGFTRSTPADGFEIYGGKGKYHNEIHLSHKGLQGSGDFEYLTSKASADEIYFFPDSTNLYTQSFSIDEVAAGIEFPDVINAETYAHFEPYNDRLEIEKISEEFNLYKGQATFSGDLLMRPTGLTGSGMMKLDKAQVTAELFTYNASWFGSDDSDLDVFSEGGKLAIEASKLKSHIDLKMKEGIFNSNGNNSYVKFPSNQYLAYIDKMNWKMDEESFILGNEISSAGNLTEFISTHPNQDSLSFTSRTASYNLKDFIINTKGVDEIAVADAIIYPDSGIVTIAKEAVVKTLFNAKILADNLTEYHTFTNALVDIKSAHKYSASGNYTYKDAMRNEQYIFFDKIRVNSDTITIARGDVATDKVFHLDSKFDFKGSVDLIAEQRNLTFNGFFRMNHNCDLLSKEWVKFNSPVNPKNINIELDEVLLNDSDEKLFAGIMMREDTFSIYSTFFNKKESVLDVELISSDYSLSYNKRTSSFIINGKDSLDNKFTLFENTCKTKGEGEIDLNLDLGKVQVRTIGLMNHDIHNDRTDIKGFVLLDFFFSDQALISMVKDINGPNKNGMGYDEYDEFYILNMHRLIRDKAKTSQFILDLEFNKINSIPEEVSSTFVFTDINMIWDKKNKAFVNKGDFGLGNILSNPINDNMGGFVVFEKKHGNAGDGLSILMKTFEGESYWFKYQSNAMWAFSYNVDFTTPIGSLGASKRKLEGSKFNYSLKSESIFEKQLKQLKKKY